MEKREPPALLQGVCIRAAAVERLKLGSSLVASRSGCCAFTATAQVQSHKVQRAAKKRKKELACGPVIPLLSKNPEKMKTLEEMQVHRCP